MNVAHIRERLKGDERTKRAGGQGWNRTIGVSNVGDLQSLALAAMHTYP